jgi:cell division septation protein DedD
MNRDDNDDQEAPSENGSDPQLSFDQDALDDSPRRLEPIFDDQALDDSESTQVSFKQADYGSDYDEDSIDYDVDPENLMDDDKEEDGDSQLDPESPALWQAAELKPELEREVLSDLEPAPDIQNEDPEDWIEDDDVDGPWPLGLMVVAAIALLLLAAGGYGVMQQRASMQEEIRFLQAAAATSASPEDVASSRESQRVLTQRNTELSATIDALQAEISSLQDTTAGLESQLSKLNSEAAKTVPPIKAKQATAKQTIAKPVPTEKPKASNGNWFVNFGSYQKKDTADSWAIRLKPKMGEVVVVSGLKSGEIFYRVRVVSLESKSQAETIARVLEREHDLPRLWIGEQ